MITEFIGVTSEKVKNVVEKELVRRFADSIGDLHPIYIDEETGKNSRYGKNIAPVTFPRVFRSGEVDGLNLPNKGLIHGEQIYHYNRPLFVGEEVYCYSKIEDYFEKEGSTGKMGFLKMKRYGEDTEGNIIFTEESIIIITETVRRSMNV
ncbi:MaoC family dehydratase N-terminal domain-containing protein [Ureibacillus sp. 179-F W5.1 NHS]|uniref:MaoC family dehydratase n=1 Tax=Lysinibacillus halotolerans TaxID=1368476 RepID=A0A3M8HG64_9BACI|nr:MaoC family dehydratase N-terminal domain-containing protein [Lysinibacillus halotolerans]RND01369.1 MaoC family dehydratase [Lysinibacillus halotolerans]